uniref:Ro60, Y RNA binding protein n=1 Tax=Paramormyrops kingsleyae TaxID=1676925 RepID=A0A3B3TGE6_9TELE|nr:60 kDa SS-A/Ro ribonucleoprotein [Paramormyrops kingsleyae]XP_023662169.1 60 kDa SS-A/Ro ribonucleoprotein [Paramormyrops kingsleyae]XP_023662170.1 60 kDa SS-A/Ro ribonucleoprotein [Paramormyrops kingsleyae]
MDPAEGALPVTDMTRLRRFLCFGSEGSMYGAKGQQPGMENTQMLMRLIEDGRGCEVVEEIRRFSRDGASVAPSPALFALAVCSQQPDAKTKQAAYEALGDVCRFPTHLFSFVQFKKELKEGMHCGIWGRALRKAVSDWYNQKEAMSLAVAVTKCKQRTGWSHKDLLRLSHMKPANPGISLINKYITKGWKEVQATYSNTENSDEVAEVLRYLEAVEKVKHSTDEVEVIHLIEEHGLEPEQLLTSHLKSREVCKALLTEMPVVTLLSRLGKMTADNVLQQRSSEAALVCERLQSESALRKDKIHPFHILLAQQAYKKGQANRGKVNWETDHAVLQALDAAFNKCLMNVEPTGKRFVVAVDVCMSANSTVLGSYLNATTAAAAITMGIARAETEPQILVFSEGAVIPSTVTTDMSLAQVTAELAKSTGGATNCVLPILWATENQKPTDVFIILTSNTTSLGRIHTAEALRMHRYRMGLSSKLIVCGLTSNGFSIADPEDRGMIDICGFDSGALHVIQNFILDQI